MEVPPDPQIPKIVGKYRSRALATDVKIYLADDTLRMHADSRFGSVEWSLECIGARVWRANSSLSIFLDGVLAFDSAWDGFLLSSYILRLLAFSRVH